MTEPPVTGNRPSPEASAPASWRVMALVALVVTSGYLIVHNPPRPTPSSPGASVTGHEPGAPPVEAAHAVTHHRPAATDELRVVAPLAPGSKLDGWVVSSIEGTDAGYLSVLLTEEGKPGSKLEAQVFLLVREAPPPVAIAGAYALYYRGGREDPPVAAAMKALARVVENSGAPPPAGMTAYLRD